MSTLKLYIVFIKKQWEENHIIVWVRDHWSKVLSLLEGIYVKLQEHGKEMGV